MFRSTVKLSKLSLHQIPGTKTESVSFNWICAVVHMKRWKIVFKLTFRRIGRYKNTARGKFVLISSHNSVFELFAHFRQTNRPYPLNQIRREFFYPIICFAFFSDSYLPFLYIISFDMSIWSTLFVSPSEFLSLDALKITSYLQHYCATFFIMLAFMLRLHAKPRMRPRFWWFSVMIKHLHMSKRKSFISQKEKKLCSVFAICNNGCAWPMFVFSLTFGFNHFNFSKRKQLLNFGTYHFTISPFRHFVISPFRHFAISCFKHAPFSSPITQNITCIWKHSFFAKMRVPKNCELFYFNKRVDWNGIVVSQVVISASRHFHGLLFGQSLISLVLTQKHGRKEQMAFTEYMQSQCDSLGAKQTSILSFTRLEQSILFCYSCHTMMLYALS